MKGLDKSQIKRRDEIVAALRAKAGEVEAAEEAAQAAITALNDVVEEYNDLVTEANDFVIDVAGEARDHIDERSERWAESDRGQEVTGWVEEWESADFDPLDLAELTFGFDPAAADDLESLPDNV